MFLSGGQSELEATLNLNAMNQKPNPWHVSFSYARALQNTCLKTWQGEEANVKAAQARFLFPVKIRSPCSACLVPEPLKAMPGRRLAVDPILDYKSHFSHIHSVRVHLRTQHHIAVSNVEGLW